MQILNFCKQRPRSFPDLQWVSFSCPFRCNNISYKGAAAFHRGRYFLAFSGCKSNTVYVPVESVRTEYRDRLQRDSVYLYDSVFMKLRGDTIWLEKYKYIYRDRLRTDTVAKSDTIAIPYPVVETREVKTYPRWLVVLACIGSLAAGIAGWRIYDKVSSFLGK